jgi:hypothetical protein
MERDAAPSNAGPSYPDPTPPVAIGTVRTTGLVGIGLIAIAVLIGLAAAAAGPLPSTLSTARLFLVLIGAITVGAAISMRYELWWVWAMGAAAALLAWGGLPTHWDSFRLLCRVLAGVALAGVAMCLLPRGWRLGAASAVMVFHFTGIFMATTSPPTDPLPAPWITVQAFGRVYNPYLQFIYLRNAYHFYSPNPGPASVLAFLLKTETTDPVTGAKSYKTEWVVVPKRPDDVRDPLGLSYYRRLSLTEQLARGAPGPIVPDQFEKREMKARRASKASAIPYHPTEILPSEEIQYKLPNPDVSRFLIPSYASHVIMQHTPNKETAGKTTVKVYRIEHRTMSPEEFGATLPNGRHSDPYHPGTYRPYFLGEFDARGNLINPQEELLYWLLPIIPQTPIPNDPDNPFQKAYIDYMSVHALDMLPKDVLKADESKGPVFNWSQLR